MTDEVMTATVLVRALERLGYRQASVSQKSLAFWEREDARAGGERIVVPLVRDAPDFPYLLDDSARQLHNLHGVEFSQAVDHIRLLQQRRLDEVAVHQETGNHSGLIGWDAGNGMIEAARGMLGAAARASNATRRRFAQAQSAIAEDFLENCYMGQTQVGSYVVTALVPSERLFATSKADGDKHPMLPGRYITATLARSLSAVRDAVDAVASHSEPIDVFEDQIAHGVSFELLHALETLTRKRDSEVVVQYTVNDDRVDAAADARQTFQFTPQDGEIISQARTSFEAAPATQPVVFSGEVTFLKNSTSALEHRISLQGRLNGKPRTIVVNMSAPQYEKAVAAHAGQVYLTVSGELEHRTRGSVINSPSTVRVESVPVGGNERPNAQIALWDEVPG